MPKKSVSVKEFEAFKKESADNTATILDAIKGLSEKPVVNEGRPVDQEASRRVYSVTGGQTVQSNPTVAQASANSANYTLNPAHQAILNEYFDPEDGFEGRLENMNFTIIVPSKFSNADAAWKKYYQTDTRTRVLKYDDIEGGIRKWCEMVAANLQYNKNVKTR